MTSRPHILMSPPDHYAVEYEINPWMSRGRPSDHGRAMRQWKKLRRVLEAAGATISCVDAVARLPDLVFTANAALVCDDLAILSRFRHPERQKEESHFRRWFVEQGYRIHDLKESAHFEGAGDTLFCGTTLFAGYHIRSDIKAHEEIAAVLGCRVVPLELVDARFYHLDTCFCPVAPGRAVYYPGAFDRYGHRVLGELVEELIPVDAQEAGRLACNAVVIGRNVATPAGCPRLEEALRARGFATCEVSLSEFIKSGGAAKCLTLRLDGEDARTRPPPSN